LCLFRDGQPPIHAGAAALESHTTAPQSPSIGQLDTRTLLPHGIRASTRWGPAPGLVAPGLAADRHREGWHRAPWRQMCQSEPQLSVRWTGHGGVGSEGVATARATQDRLLMAPPTLREMGRLAAVFNKPMACLNQFDEHIDPHNR